MTGTRLSLHSENGWQTIDAKLNDCQSEQFHTEVWESFSLRSTTSCPLADGGPDILENTVAVCPTHHRLLHHGKDRQLIVNQLTQKRKLDTRAPIEGAASS